MSVVEANTIDMVGVDPLSGFVILTISDHLPWENNERLLLLQEKLNTYLRFIESGEIFDVYEDAKGRSVAIDVIFQYAPSAQGIIFLKSVSDLLSATEIKFSYKVFDSKD